MSDIYTIANNATLQKRTNSAYVDILHFITTIQAKQRNIILIKQNERHDIKQLNPLTIGCSSLWSSSVQWRMVDCSSLSSLSGPKHNKELFQRQRLAHLDPFLIALNYSNTQSLTVCTHKNVLDATVIY